MQNLNELCLSVYKRNAEKGFWNEREFIPKYLSEEGMLDKEEVSFVKNALIDQMLMLIVSELGEAIDAKRKGATAELSEELKSSLFTMSSTQFEEEFRDNVKDTFEDEIADAFIRILDLCGGLGIDLDFHVKSKLKYNSLRPVKHGKAY